MALPERKFTVGRSSELLYNEELHKVFESTRHLLDIPAGKDGTPEAGIDGAVWLDRKHNILYSYNAPSNTWIPVFKEKHQIVDQITNQLPPSNPVKGQLWLNNDVLLYYSGAEWRPVKALEQDGSQFNLSVFANFNLTSPLWKIGNTIIKDEDVESFKEIRKKYFQGKIDFANNSSVIGDGSKWDFDHECNLDELKLDDITLNGYSQLLVPNIDLDRIFLDNRIDFNYNTSSKVCIEYEKSYIGEKIPSLVHVNPGRVIKLRKRLVKVDRINPYIKVDVTNTEFYGFRGGDIYGRFMRPLDNDRTGDYEILSDGIYLSYEAVHNYDYVLIVDYDFSWFRSSGTMKKVTNSDLSTSYFIQDYRGPINVFVNGYELEDPCFKEDNLTQVVSLGEETSGMEVSFMSSVKREFGFIRHIDLKGRAVIKLLHKYKKPLIFMNGEALHPAFGDLEFDKNYVYVNNGKRDMAWCAVELYDEENDYDMTLDVGLVTDTDISGEPVITFDTSQVNSDDGLILFIDGLLVKKEDLIIDYVNGELQVAGTNFVLGQEYILLKDKFHRLYDETKLIPAYPVGTFSESLVYLNNHLICNDTAVATTASVEELSAPANIMLNIHNEVKFFLKSDLNREEGEFRVWDSEAERWNLLPVSDADAIKSFAYSYSNSLRSIDLNKNITLTSDDNMVIYAFNYADSIEHPLVIRNIPYSFQEYDDYYNAYVEAIRNNDTTAEAEAKIELDKVTEERNSFAISDTFIPNIGALSVWVNGVRQYEVNEWLDGTGFDLPNKVAGIVTYVIENPEHGDTKVAEREILDKNNVAPGTINVYKTTKPLYPGRVILYVNGIRQPQDAFAILDNYTLLINDESTKLIGSPNNFPAEKRLDKYGQPITINHKSEDKLLVVVKQDFDRRENFVEMTKDTKYEIDITKNDLPIDVLEAIDEIMIYIDGLFFGLANLIGYQKDRNRGCIRILDSEVAARLFSDPLYTYLKSDPQAMQLYKKNNNGEEYDPGTRKLILDWR